MKFSRTDILFSFACLSIIAVCSSMIISNFRSAGTGSGEKIGYILMKKRIAKRKFSNDTVWSPVEKRSDLFNYDTLHTEDDSMAVIYLKDGTELKMEEKSLVVLSLQEKGFTVDFQSGGLTAVKKTDRASSEKLTITLGDSKKTVDMKSGDVSLNTADDVTTVNVSKGEVEVTTETGTKTIDNKQLVAIKPESVETRVKTIQLTAPANQSHYITTAFQEKVLFNWSTDSKRRSLFELARDNRFKKVTVSRRVNRQQYTTTLSEGTYYWRVRLDDNRSVSETRTVTVVEEKAIELKEPPDKAIFSYLDKYPGIRFNWDGCYDAPYYEIEISRDRSFQVKPLTVRSQVRTLSSNRLQNGTYYWRIKAYYPHAVTGPLVSKSRMFTVTKRKKYLQPAVISPRENERISSLTCQTGKALFNWQGDQEINQFRVLIAGDKNFKNMVAQKVTGNSFYSLHKNMATGRYYFKVTGLVSGKGVVESPVVPFSIVEPKDIKLVYPGNGEEVVLSNKKNIMFNWSDPNFGDRYLFEISKDRRFKRVIEKRILSGSRASVAFSASLLGRHFWRVFLIDKNEKRLSDSKIYSFRVFKRPARPVGIYPLHAYTINMTNKNNIVFKWKYVEGAAQYRFNLYRVHGSKNKKVFSRIIKGNKLSFSQLALLDVGNFSWNVEAVSVKNRKVSMISKSDTYLFTIRLQERLVAPVLEQPEVIYIK